jgi:voltage-gated potassium channel
MAVEDKIKQRNPNLALAIALVSILSVINSFLAFIIIDPYVRDVINIITLYLSFFFVLNLIYRLIVADSKAHYLIHEWGWVDLLACIPFIQISWLFRGLRAYLTLHHLRFDRVREDVKREGAEFTLFIAVFLVIVILETCAVSIMYFEGRSSDPIIKSAQDALWWAYVTISSVGYGDMYPTTAGGRFVGIVLMTTGVGIYATIAGYFAHRLIYRRATVRTEGSVITTEENLRLCDLDKRLQDLEDKEEKILDRLERIEHLLRANNADTPAGEPDDPVLRDRENL